MATKDLVIHIRVSKQTKAALVAEAKKDKRKLSSLCEIILADYVAAGKKTEAA